MVTYCSTYIDLIFSEDLCIAFCESYDTYNSGKGKDLNIFRSSSLFHFYVNEFVQYIERHVGIMPSNLFIVSVEYLH
jgi:hypothetical protein